MGVFCDLDESLGCTAEDVLALYGDDYQIDDFVAAEIAAEVNVTVDPGSWRWQDVLDDLISEFARRGRIWGK